SRRWASRRTASASRRRDFAPATAAGCTCCAWFARSSDERRRVASLNIDLHFHHTPRFFLDELQGANPWGKALHGSGDALSVRIGPIEIPISAEHWDIDRTLAVMDARRIDVAAVSPSPLLFHTQWPVEVALPLHRRVNDALAEIARAHPDRFAPLG